MSEHLRAQSQSRLLWTPTEPTCRISPLSTKLTPALHASVIMGWHVKLARKPLALAADMLKAPAVNCAVTCGPFAWNSYADELTFTVSPS